MPLDQSENFVRGGVASGIGSADSEVTVDNASIYPALSGGRYNVVVWDAGDYAIPGDDPDREILRVTGRDAANDVLTVKRGQENTSASIHQKTSNLMMSPTAKMFQDIQRNAAGITTLEAKDMASSEKRYHRDYVADGEVFSLYKIGPLDGTGSATSGISASVIDSSSDSTYYSTTSPSERGDPLKKVYGPASLNFELSADVSGADLSARWKYDISRGVEPLTASWPVYAADKRATNSTKGPVPQSSVSEVETFDSGSSFDGGYNYQVIHTGDRIAYAAFTNSGSGSSVVLLFDPSDGSLISSTNIENELSSGYSETYQLTSIQNGEIFAFGDTYGVGVAGAVDKDGNGLWYFNSDNFADNGYACAPSEWNGNVLVASSSDSFTGPRLAELDGKTGSLVNVVDLSNPNEARTTENTKPIVDTDREVCFVYTEDGDYISEVDLNTFTETVRYESAGDNYHSDTFLLGPNGDIYPSHENATVRWNPATDTIEWSTTSSDFSTDPSYTQWLYYEGNDTLFGVGAGGIATSLDVSDGSINYEVPANFDPGNYTDMIGVIDQENGVAAYGPDNNNKIFAYDVTDGTELWSYDYGSDWYSHLSHDAEDDTILMWSIDIGNGNSGLVKFGLP